MLEPGRNCWRIERANRAALIVDAAGEEPAIRDFAREFRMTYPIWLDPDERVSSTFLLVGVPGTFLIAKDGRVARAWRKVKVPGHAAEVLAAVKVGA